MRPRLEGAPAPPAWAGQHPELTGALTCRSYAHDLLRWFRLLWAVDVGWEQATEAEVATLVGWLRAAGNPQWRRRRNGGYPPGAVNPKTGKPIPAAGYAPATIAHNLSVVYGF